MKETEETGAHTHTHTFLKTTEFRMKSYVCLVNEVLQTLAGFIQNVYEMFITVIFLFPTIKLR